VSAPANCCALHKRSCPTSRLCAWHEGWHPQCPQMTVEGAAISSWWRMSICTRACIDRQTEGHMKRFPGVAWLTLCLLSIPHDDSSQFPTSTCFVQPCIYQQPQQHKCYTSQCFAHVSEAYHHQTSHWLLPCFGRQQPTYKHSTGMFIGKVSLQHNTPRRRAQPLGVVAPMQYIATHSPPWQ